VSIIDMATRSVIATPGFAGVPQAGTHLRTTVGMDFEPEYIAVDGEGKKAYVTVQEANAVAVLDLTIDRFTQVIGLGTKNFATPGNEIDPSDNDGQILFETFPAQGLYIPDGIAAYKWRGETYLLYANEGDYREDNGDRANASAYGAAGRLARLRVSSADSSQGTVITSGARSVSIRDAYGNLVYDSGSILDKQAHARGIYNDGRSRDKGVEPEGVAVLDIAGRTYAFVGLERTTSSAVAVFDVTSPWEVSFIDMIVTPGDRAPEGLAAYHSGGKAYLAIANETPVEDDGLTNTTLYRLDRVLPKPR
jgi:DNA-binding beta-propeller fold protein YncE